MGNDALPDKFLKNNTVFKAYKEKILQTFNDWYNGTEIPRYLKAGRVFALSKEDTQFPTLGKIRTITILPALTKLYELTML